MKQTRRRDFLKAGVGRTFYDLGKVGYWGPQTKGDLDFQFNPDRTERPVISDDWEAKAETAKRLREAKLERELVP